MCFKVPFGWTEAMLREAFETCGPTIAVELFRPKEGEPGFGTPRHKGFGKVSFRHSSGVEALFDSAGSEKTIDPKHGEQLKVKLAGATLVVTRELLDERAVAQEQTRHRVEAGMTTTRIQIECVGPSRVTLDLGAQHEFKLKIKNNSIKTLSLPRVTRTLPRLEPPAQASDVLQELGLIGQAGCVHHRIARCCQRWRARRQARDTDPRSQLSRSNANFECLESHDPSDPQ